MRMRMLWWWVGDWGGYRCFSEEKTRVIRDREDI